jgi:hypothetical protein
MAPRVRQRNVTHVFNGAKNTSEANGLIPKSPGRRKKKTAAGSVKNETTASPPMDLGNMDAQAAERSARIRRYLKDRQLEAANAAVFEILDERIQCGDTTLEAVRALLGHYIEIVTNMAPMAHLGCAPLRPDDRLVQVFVQVVDLMHKQNQQLHELQAIAAELM